MISILSLIGRGESAHFSVFFYLYGSISALEKLIGERFTYHLAGCLVRHCPTNFSSCFHNIIVHMIYIFQGLEKKNDIKLRVEPCVFEWTLWYPNIPQWMSLEELVAAGYNIDTEYKSFKNRNDLHAKETIEIFYSRSTEFIKKITQDHPSGNILIVGHSATLDTMTRQLVQGKGARNREQQFGLISRIPYCSMVQITETDGKWQFVDPPCPPMSYSVNHRFNWKILEEN